MSEVALVGIDLGRHSFHLHGQDKSGREAFHKKMTRPQMMRLLSNLPACTMVVEACAESHCLARQLMTFGHEAKLISPQFVRPFVKGNKNDFIDAEAICEAASRPTMRFVTPKTEAQQTLSALHQMRESLVRDRTKTINQAHGFLLEFGISLPKGLSLIRRLSANPQSATSCLRLWMSASPVAQQTVCAPPVVGVASAAKLWLCREAFPAKAAPAKTQ